MAYLMTDVAKGSDATMTLMENMGAAPVAQDVGLAKAEQVIANTQKAKLSNLVAESGFKASEESRSKLKDLQQTPEFQAALAEQDYGKVLRMSGATQMLSSDVENGAKSIAAAETFDAKKIATQQKQLDLDAQQVGNAYGVLAAVTDDKIDEFVGRLPEATRKILIDKVGADNWANMSGTEKKEASKNLMLNAKGQMAVQLKQIEAQKQELINQSRERIAFIRENAITSRRLAGDDDRDMRDWNIYTRAQENIERSGRKTIEKLDADVEAADLAQTKSKVGIFFDSSKPSADTEAAYKSAVAKRDAFRRDQVQKELNLAISAPDFPGKKTVIENLSTELELYGKPKPEEPKSNKPTIPANAKTHDGYPARKNDDGSYSTEVSITVTNPKLNNGKPTNIPSLWKGKEVDEDAAVENVLASGKKYDSFATVPEAVKAAKERSNAGGALAPNNKYTEQNPAKPTNEQEYNKLPAGSYYMQNGVLKRKKG